MPVAQSIATEKYLDIIEIQSHLKDVEYIIMAAPAPDTFKDTPIHFTIFLNTSENIPQEIQEEIFNKFLQNEGIVSPAEIMIHVMPVGFSKGAQDTPMPLLIVRQEDMNAITNTPMLVMDFLADSDNFEQTKKHSLTGWT
ncbi:MAG: hypothetical protein KAT10_01740, partial [Sulfurimonas sp.]|nr:hypothetical protein [Sulfurimonas sp.]